MAKMVAVDLHRYDSTRDENALLWRRVEILESTSRYKDTLIAQKDSTIATNNRHIAAKDTEVAFTERKSEEWKSLSEKLEKEAKKQRRNSLFKDVSSGAIIAALVAILIMK
jgi:hypothetical protein